MTGGHVEEGGLFFNDIMMNTGRVPIDDNKKASTPLPEQFDRILLKYRIAADQDSIFNIRLRNQ